MKRPKNDKDNSAHISFENIAFCEMYVPNK
jgi:hypothetical protein